MSGTLLSIYRIWLVAFVFYKVGSIEIYVPPTDDSVVLSCKVWNNEIIQDVLKKNNTSKYLITANEFQIVNLTTDDFKEYVCSDPSTTYKVIQGLVPTLQNSSSIKFVSISSAVVEIACFFKAVPVAHITWKKNGTNILNDTNVLIIENAISDSVISSTLIINNITTDYLGDYICIGTNKFGSNNNTSKMIKVYYDLERLQLTYRNLTSTSLVLRWNRTIKLTFVDPDHFIKVLWNSTESTNSTQVLARPGTFQSIKKITDLKPYTDYTFKVVQMLKDMSGAMSNTLNIRTNEGVPSAPILNSTSASTTVIELSWFEPNVKNGIITGYMVSSTYDAEGQKKVNVVCTNQTSLSIFNLYPGVTYSIEVSARTKTGYGDSVMENITTTADRPQGSPSALSVVADNNTFNISWSQVPNYLRGGIITQYVLRYIRTAGVSDNFNETKIFISSTTLSYTISDLEAFTTYQFMIFATTSVGEGPSRTIHYTTPEQRPSKPLNVEGKPYRFVGSNEQSIELSWAKPSRTNGLIRMIQFRYGKIAICSSSRCKRSMELNAFYYENHTFSSSSKRHFMLERRLDSYSQYFIEIREGTSVGFGEFSDNITVNTLSGVSSAPVNVTILKITDSSIFIKWSKPLEENGQILAYHIHTLSGQRLVGRVTYTISDDSTPLEYQIVSNVEPETSYTIQITATTDCYCGDSEGSEKIYVMTEASPAKLSVLIVVIGCLLGVLLIAILISVFLFILRRRRRYKEVKQHEDVSMNSICRSKPILITELKSYCAEQHANSDHGFQQEFENVRFSVGSFTWEHSQMPANQGKNRYSNIVAYDHSRVVLSIIDHKIHSDYINANYIDGYNKPKKYIATQGPLPETVLDFWRMVWEQRCSIIVMLTKLVEDSRVKCEQYWPEGKGLQYGDIVVTVNSVSEMTDYTVRLFTLHKLNQPDVRRDIFQYHYTAWPDHGVPSHPTSLLSFVRHVMSVMDNILSSDPIVVHCSAGVGRTGTFICIENCLRQAKEENKVDVLNHVYLMRQNRNFMVQVESQYTLIYDALLDNILCGNTEIPPTDLITKINHLKKENPQEGHTFFVSEFKRLETGLDQKNDKNHYSEATHFENKHKNRFLNILPYDTNRVRLMPVVGTRNSDYINASFIDGFQQKNAFIATQAPLENTVNEFWRMIFEQNVHIIVMLTKIEEKGQEKCYLYWPQADTISYGNIHVELVNVEAEEDKHLVVNELRLTNRETGRSWSVTHYMYLGWPDYGSPESGVELIRLIGIVQQTHRQISSGGPILVHCSGGVGRTGVFISVFNAVEMLKAKDVVDVFHTVRALRLQRTAMVQTIDQYMFCYQCLVDYLNSFHLYFNSINA